MTQNTNDIPLWVDLITPAITIFTGLNAGIVWVAKRVFLDFLDRELDKKHVENRQAMKENKEAIESLKKEVARLSEEIERVRENQLNRRRIFRNNSEDREGG